MTSPQTLQVEPLKYDIVIESSAEPASSISSRLPQRQKTTLDCWFQHNGYADPPMMRVSRRAARLAKMRYSR
jgi:hypothetical protein